MAAISFSSLLTLVFFGVIGTAALCKQAVIILRAPLFGFLLPVLVSLILLLLIIIISIVGGQSLSVIDSGWALSQIVAFWLFWGLLIGFIPATITVTVCDCLYVYQRRHWIIPIIVGGLAGAVTAYLMFDKDNAIFLVVGCGCSGGGLFAVLRQRILCLTDEPA